MEAQSDKKPTKQTIRKSPVPLIIGVVLLIIIIVIVLIVTKKKVVSGPTCKTACKNGGRCTSTNKCTCSTGFTGSDCGTVVTNAACDPTCKNGGQCSNGQCLCANGWSGVECTQDNTYICSPPCNNGSCNSSLACVCSSGWTGSACETPTSEEQNGVTFYSGANYAGSIKTFPNIGTFAVYLGTSNFGDCTNGTDGIIGFKPRSFKIPANHTYTIRGYYAGAGDTQCGPGATTWPESCSANIYAGGNCANTWIGTNASNGQIIIAPL